MLLKSFLSSLSMILQTVQELQAKNHFLYIDKCHNSVINYQKLPINNPKRDIVSTNSYAKFIGSLRKSGGQNIDIISLLLNKFS